MDQKQNFFTKVSTRKERERAFVLLVETRAKIECQFVDNKTIYELEAQVLKDSFMVVRCLDKSVELGSEAILTFNIGQEKYFMKTTLSNHDLSDHYVIDLEPALFKLQRRNSFRVIIPQGYLAKVHVQQVEKQKVSKKFALYDLSGGGFAFEILPNSEVQIEKNQLIHGEIEVGGKFKKRFSAIVRHCINIGSQGSGLKKIGVEFTALSQTEQQEFINIVMDIHRDMFSKFKIGSR